MGIPAKNIDEVINELDKILRWSSENSSRPGYFAALYRKVTIEVKEKIASNYFDDGERMEKLDVIFANRYLLAFNNFNENKPVPKSWQLAFDTTQKWSPIVLQHLLLGMNAHINFDLGIAAAETSPGKSINDLKEDFNKINSILASLVDEVSDKLSGVWPLLKLLDWIAGKTDEALINFSMENARDQAWKTALRFSALNKNSIQIEESKLDNWVSIFGGVITNPGWFINLLLKIIRLGEIKSTSKIIEILK